MSQPARIISGGQTGADRAALDAALRLGLPCGGWCPSGRRAEDGPIDARYPLRETESRAYKVRTRRNVEDADGTLILARGTLKGGTRLTRNVARRLGRPCLVLDPDRDAPGTLCDWLAANSVGVLNVAGPRASSDSGIYEAAYRFLLAALSRESSLPSG